MYEIKITEDGKPLQHIKSTDGYILVTQQPPDGCSLDDIGETDDLWNYLWMEATK